MRIIEIAIITDHQGPGVKGIEDIVQNMSCERSFDISIPKILSRIFNFHFVCILVNILCVQKLKVDSRCLYCLLPYILNQGLLLYSGLIDWLSFMDTELRDPPPFKAVLTDTQFYPSARETDSGSYDFAELLPTEISL